MTIYLNGILSNQRVMNELKTIKEFVSWAQSRFHSHLFQVMSIEAINRVNHLNCTAVEEKKDKKGDKENCRRLQPRETCSRLDCTFFERKKSKSNEKWQLPFLIGSFRRLIVTIVAVFSMALGSRIAYELDQLHCDQTLRLLSPLYFVFFFSSRRRCCFCLSSNRRLWQNALEHSRGTRSVLYESRLKAKGDSLESHK